MNIGSKFCAVQNFKRDNQDPSSLCEAAVLTMRCLHGKYESANVNELKIDGDLQKVRSVRYRTRVSLLLTTLSF